MRLKKALLRRLYASFNAINHDDRMEKLRKAATFDQKVVFNDRANILNHQANPGVINIGSHSTVCGTLLVFRHGGRIEMGKYVYLGEGAHIWSSNTIAIGNHVLISHNVNIHDGNSHPVDSELRRHHTEYILNTQSLPDKSDDTIDAPIKIGDDVWIGFNAIILKGVTVGRGAIIAAGSVVTRDVDNFTLVAGNPARFKKRLT